MKRTLTLSLAVTLLGIFTWFGTAYTKTRAPHLEGHGGPPEIILHRTNPHTAGQAVPAGSTGKANPAINYRGGPVISTPVIYIIWYGNWNQANNSDTPSGQQIVRDFANSIGNSPYFNINATYGGVSGNVLFGRETSDNYSRGSNLQDSDVQTIVANAISSNQLPYDADGVYFVLTSSDVSEASGFCSRYCGWHTAGTPSVGHIRYSFVGNANRCLSSCAIQTIGPNGNAGVDAMISVIAHELEEAATDPDINAWLDNRGAENADKCAWTFGSRQFKASNGAFYNMTLGSRNYLIQRNLAATDSKCYTDYGNRYQ